MDDAAHRSMAAVEQQHWWFRGRRVLIDRLLQAHLGDSPSIRLLEVGSGTGGNLALLSKYGSVTAIEPGVFAAAHIAEQHPQVDVIEAFWPAAAAELGHFDVALFLDVLEHLDDDVAALSALHGHLTAAASVIVTVPAYQWMWSEHDVSLWHRRRYTRNQLARVAEAAGFSISFNSHFNAVLLPAAWLARRLGLAGATSDDLPRPVLNRLFGWILTAEASLVGRGVTLPFGLSIAAVLREAEHA